MLTDVQLLDLSEENLLWFSENSAKIRKDFEGKVVAIRDKKIIASANNTVVLLNILKEMKIDDSEVLIERILSKNEIRIL